MANRALPQGPLVARKAFRFGGKPYGPGDAFPWRRLSCSERKLRVLMSGNYLTTKDQADEARDKAAGAADRRDAARNAGPAPKPKKEKRTKPAEEPKPEGEDSKED